MRCGRWTSCSIGVAGGRAIKCLVIVDDATHESVAIVPAHHISGQQVVRILERIGSYRGLPKIIRTDNGAEFCGKAMLTWRRPPAFSSGLN